MRTIHERSRGCGHRAAGGCYLCGEPSVMGTLPTVVVVDPPIPVDVLTIPWTRGIYIVDFDRVFDSDDQRTWLAGSSQASLLNRDRGAWEKQQYGMSLHQRCSVGICAGCNPAQAEVVLAGLKPIAYNWRLADLINSLGNVGSKKVAREVATMQRARMDKDWKGLLAACWRLADYRDKDADVVKEFVKRLMAGIGAAEDAVLI